MKTLAPVGKLVAWLVSLAAFLGVIAIILVSSSLYAPRNGAEWATVIGISLSCLLTVIALNPLSWRMAPFNSVTRRLLFAIIGVCAAMLVSTFGAHAPRTGLTSMASASVDGNLSLATMRRHC